MAEQSKRHKRVTTPDSATTGAPVAMAESMPRKSKPGVQDVVVVPVKPIAVGLAAAALAGGVKETSLFEAISTGRLPAKKWNGRTLILWRDLENFLYSLPARPITRAARPSPVTEEQVG
jgi:hypothetical protein